MIFVTLGVRFEGIWASLRLYSLQASGSETQSSISRYKNYSLVDKQISFFPDSRRAMFITLIYVTFIYSCDHIMVQEVSKIWRVPVLT